MAGYGATFNGTNNIIRSTASAGGTVYTLAGTSTDDPQLGLLADNGGPTQSILPQNTSPAADAGDDGEAAGLDYDQRGAGYPRVDGPHVDIGAIEFFGVVPYTLIYTAGANGSITGSTLQFVQGGNDGSAVTAQPDAHYHFVQWSDAVTDNPRTRYQRCGRH